MHKRKITQSVYITIGLILGAICGGIVGYLAFQIYTELMVSKATSAEDVNSAILIGTFIIWPVCLVIFTYIGVLWARKISNNANAADR